MSRGYTAEASVNINAPATRVWDALTDPAQVKQYFFGTDLETDWQVGSPMTFRGVWEGTPYEDFGTVLAMDHPTFIAYSHWSPLSGRPDTPENRHVLEYNIEPRGARTLLTLLQDNNATEDE